jgi:fumarate hydratase class II
MNTRTERDSLGTVEVPETALYGAQTQRAFENFRISPFRFPRAFIAALGAIKAAAARANAQLELVDPGVATSIANAAAAVARGDHDQHFPLDIFQTGSGTSTNMNANEVIAHLASAESGKSIHPNDHVNYGQSSNDVIPTAIHVSGAVEIHARLIPALHELANALERRAAELAGITKTGRTHLMDAVPLSFGQELAGWRAQILSAIARLEFAVEDLSAVALGGTAIGTGLNTHPEFAALVTAELARETDIAFHPAENRMAVMAAQDPALNASAALRGVATVLLKISNDLRWMNSGPISGLAEITLTALQPGSSIMPAKVNPVIPEAVAMVCAQVTGNDTAITIAAQSGNFQLNVMLPLIAWNLLSSIELLTNASHALATKAIAGFTVNKEALEAKAARNPILATALNPVIGYDEAAKIAKESQQTGESVFDVARRRTNLDEAQLRELLDPAKLTGR